jgi:hypothetical protein
MRRCLSASLAMLCLAASCTGLVIEEEDGDGPLRVFRGDGVHVSQADPPVGEVWSAGSVPLCKDEGRGPVVLVSIEPIELRGDVEVEGIRVRTTKWGLPDRLTDMDTHMVGLSPGLPAGLRTPRGYVVPSTCDSPRDPVGEVVVSLRKIGAGGGAVDGFVLRYLAEDRLHEFVLRFGVTLCGTERLPSCDR